MSCKNKVHDTDDPNDRADLLILDAGLISIPPGEVVADDGERLVWDAIQIDMPEHLDTGAEMPSSAYWVWIYNRGDGRGAAVFSLSPRAPTGITSGKWAAGWIYNNEYSDIESVGGGSGSGCLHEDPASSVRGGTYTNRNGGETGRGEVCARCDVSVSIARLGCPMSPARGLDLMPPGVSLPPELTDAQAIELARRVWVLTPIKFTDGAYVLHQSPVDKYWLTPTGEVFRTSMATGTSFSLGSVYWDLRPGPFAPLPGLLAISSLSLSLGLVERATRHPDGEAETDTTHTVMVALVAAAVAPIVGVDPAEAALFALVHDLPEALVGDTDTLFPLTPAEQEEKKAKEDQATSQIVHCLPGIGGRLLRYQAQEAPSARLVHLIDKLVPRLVTIQDRGAAVQARGMTRESFAERMTAQNEQLAEECPEFPAVHALLASTVEEVLKAWMSPVDWSCSECGQSWQASGEYADFDAVDLHMIGMSPMSCPCCDSLSVEGVK